MVDEVGLLKYYFGNVFPMFLCISVGYKQSHEHDLLVCVFILIITYCNKTIIILKSNPEDNEKDGQISGTSYYKGQL